MNIKPQGLSEFIGNKEAIEKLKMLLDAANIRGRMPPHLAILGPKGRGKTLLAELIAQELSAAFYIFNGSAIRTDHEVRDIMAHTAYQPPRTVVAIDEVHAVPKRAVNCLLSVLETGLVTWNFRGKIYNERIVKPHTIILMTTDEWQCFPPLLSRCIKILLRPYSIIECAKIALNAFIKMELKVSNEAIMEIAKRSNGEARQVIQYVKNTNDFATINNLTIIDINAIRQMFNKILYVDENGLQNRDIEVLRILKKIGPSSIETIAIIMDEPIKNLRIRENLLIKNNFITIGGYGRELTTNGEEYLIARERLT
jgi:Holliday junction DNA helicase RuvB